MYKFADMEFAQKTDRKINLRSIRIKRVVLPQSS